MNRPALVLVLLLGLFVCFSSSLELLKDGSFEGSVNASWLPFLSGFYRSSESQCRSGKCLSVTPHAVFGAYQHVVVDPKTVKGNVLTLNAYVNGEWNTMTVKVTALHLWKLLLARWVSQNFGTLFVDDVSLDLGETESCETGHLSHQEDEVLSAVEKGPQPPEWSKSKMCTVALVSARDSDYVASLSQLHRDWPLVVVLLASNPEESKAEFSRFEDLVDKQKGQLLVAASAVANHFPQNALRALGQTHCPKTATHVLHLDSGMVPSSSLFRLDEDLLKEDELVIVPAFELDVPEMKLPQIEDKDMLKKAGDLSPLHVGHHILSTHSTDYAKWSACTEDYRIRPVVSGALAEELGRGVTEVVAANVLSSEPEMFNRHFSPVLIVPRRTASFDTRLWHHGHERSALLAEWLMRPNHVFRVLCHGFVVRAKSDDSLLVKEDHLMTNERALEIWKRWYTFLGGKLALHNGSAPLFRSMPFVDDSKDHRLDRPFGTRVLIALSAIGVSFLLLRTLLRMRERPVEKQF